MPASPRSPEDRPPRVRVVGLEPLAIELGLELTPPVVAGVQTLLDAIAAHLGAWQRAYA